MVRVTLAFVALSLYAASGLAASTKTAPQKPATPTKAQPAKKASRIVIRPVKSQKLVLQPRIPVSTEPSRFEIARIAGRATELELRFTSRDPGLKLDSSAPMVIQLNTPSSLKLEPSIITGSQWPKGATKMFVKLKSAVARGTWIEGDASYTVCKGSTCRQAQSSIRADFP
jgi:hypothetical protein